MHLPLSLQALSFFASIGALNTYTNHFCILVDAQADLGASFLTRSNLTREKQMGLKLEGPGCAPLFYVRPALLSPSMASREPGAVGELMFKRFQTLITA